MNSHLMQHISGEKFIAVMRSIEFFILTVIALSVLGFIFLAAV